MSLSTQQHVLVGGLCSSPYRFSKGLNTSSSYFLIALSSHASPLSPPIGSLSPPTSTGSSLNGILTKFAKPPLLTKTNF